MILTRDSVTTGSALLPRCERRRDGSVVVLATNGGIARESGDSNYDEMLFSFPFKGNIILLFLAISMMFGRKTGTKKENEKGPRVVCDRRGVKRNLLGISCVQQNVRQTGEFLSLGF